MITITLDGSSVNIDLGEDKRAWVTTERGTTVYQNVLTVWLVGKEVTIIKKESEEQEEEN
jgi:hypothetical protein